MSSAGLPSAQFGPKRKPIWPYALAVLTRTEQATPHRLSCTLCTESGKLNGVTSVNVIGSYTIRALEGVHLFAFEVPRVPESQLNNKSSSDIACWTILEPVSVQYQEAFPVRA